MGQVLTCLNVGAQHCYDWRLRFFLLLLLWLIHGHGLYTETYGTSKSLKETSYPTKVLGYYSTGRVQIFNSLIFISVVL